MIVEINTVTNIPVAMYKDNFRSFCVMRWSLMSLEILTADRAASKIKAANVRGLNPTNENSTYNAAMPKNINGM